jgi:hypothetical protein
LQGEVSQLNDLLARMIYEQAWSGAWIDGSADQFEKINKNLAFLLHEGRLKARYSFITAENIESLFKELGAPAKFDLLSIDIDGNDYWIWKAIEAYRTAACVVPYDPYKIWDGTNYTGAGLKALENLGREKGYSLVGCNYTGVTSFFVRNDLVGGHFAEPFTSENYFEPPRYFVRMPNGHPGNFSPTLDCSGGELLVMPRAGVG